MSRLGFSFGSIALLVVACGGNEASNKPDEPVDDDDTTAEEGKLDAGKDAGRAKDGGKDSTTGKPEDASTAALVKLPCDVDRVVTEKCGGCHGEDPSAPVQLLTAQDFQAQSADNRAMYATVKTKINSADPRTRMPPTSDDPLTAEELATLNAWLDKKAPGSNDKCTTSTSDAGASDAGDKGNLGVVDPDDPSLTCYRLLAHNGDGKTPLPVGIAPDVYYAFIYAAPWTDTAYGMVVRPIIDNKKALHHWLLFQDNVPGIPSGAIPQIGAHPTGQLLAAWAPGADPMDFRGIAKDSGGVGLELPSSTTYTVEFHYNSDDGNAKDASGVEVCVAKEKPKNIAAYSWVGYDNVGFPSANWTGNCAPLSLEPIHIVSFMPHMHLKGIHMKGTVNRANGTKEVVHDQPFDFNYQRSYAVDVTLNPGDSITTECRYSEPSVFGQPTNMEMCYLFSMAYPKGALATPDIWGTIAHGSSSCLGQ